MTMKMFRWIFLGLLLLVHGVVTFSLDQELCSFRADNYSLEWAYEPITKNVVFMLKVNNASENFWTGVGIGKRNMETIDFIGIFVRKGQLGIADAHIGENGSLIPDHATNVQSIAFSLTNHQLTAKFARALNSTDRENDHDLSGCTTLYFPTLGGIISPAGIIPDFNVIKEKMVCNIDKKCEVDMSRKIKAINSMHNGDQEFRKDDLVVSHSVDISGTGDPCGFKGVGYMVNWTYNTGKDTVDFVMKIPVKSGKWWSAVGIGDNMNDMDIGIIFVEGGNVRRILDYYSNSYDVPAKDNIQDWKLDRKRTKKIGQEVEIYFSRQLDTEDPEKDRTLNGCVLFQFAANLGKYGPNYSVEKHEDWPDLYKACDLKAKCSENHMQKRDDNEATPNPPTETSNSNEINTSGTDSSILTSEGETTPVSFEANSDSSPSTQIGSEPTTSGGVDFSGAVTESTTVNPESPTLFNSESTAASQTDFTTTIFGLNPIFLTDESAVPVTTGEVTTTLGGEVTTTLGGEATTTLGGEVTTTLGGEVTTTLGGEATTTLGGEVTTPSASDANFASSVDLGSTPVPPGLGITPALIGNQSMDFGSFLGSNTLTPGNVSELGNGLSTLSSGVSLGSEQTSISVVPLAEGTATTLLPVISAEGETATTLLSSDLPALLSTAASLDGVSATALTPSVVPLNDSLPSESSSTLAPASNETTSALIPSLENNATISSQGLENATESTTAAPLEADISQATTGNTELGETTSVQAESEASTQQGIITTSIETILIESTPLVVETNTTTQEIPLELEKRTTSNADESTTKVLEEETTISILKSAAGRTIGLDIGAGMRKFVEVDETTGKQETDKVTRQPVEETSRFSSSFENTDNLETNRKTTLSTNDSDGSQLGVTRNSTGSIEVEGSGEGAKDDNPFRAEAERTRTGGSLGTGDSELGLGRGKSVTRNRAATSTTVNNGRSQTVMAISGQPANLTSCSRNSDLPVCQKYMEDYIGRVKVWADQHKETLNEQYPKACTLLASVPHVPEMCCVNFWKTCTGYLSEKDLSKLGSTKRNSMGRS